MSQSGNFPNADDTQPIPSPFAAPKVDAARPYVVRYELAARHRGGWLTIVALLSLTASLHGQSMLMATYFGSLVLPLAGLVFAMYVFFVAADDLRTMRSGARDSAGYWLTLFAQYFGLAVVIWIIASFSMMLYVGF